MYNEYDDFYNDGYGGDYGYDSYGQGIYKPMKATTRNVQDYIGFLLGVDSYSLDFDKVDEPPNLNDWRHSCYKSGVIKMEVNQFIYEDGSNIIYATCPFCNKVHYYIDRAVL